jgi:hypothetical protein
MDNDAHRIELLSSEKSQLQGQIGELTAKIRNLEGQVISLNLIMQAAIKPLQTVISLTSLCNLSILFSICH